MDIAAKLSIIFSAVGAIAGVMSGFMTNAWLSLLIAIILLYATYKLISNASKTSTGQFMGEMKKVTLSNFSLFFSSLTTKGELDEKETKVRFWFASYFIMWLLLWIMVYTILLIY